MASKEFAELLTNAISGDYGSLEKIIDLYMPLIDKSSIVETIHSAASCFTDNEIQNLIFLVGFLTEIRLNFLKSFCLTTKLPKDESLLLYEDILLYLDN